MHHRDLLLGYLSTASSSSTTTASGTQSVQPSVRPSIPRVPWLVCCWSGQAAAVSRYSHSSVSQPVTDPSVRPTESAKLVRNDVDNERK